MKYKEEGKLAKDLGIWETSQWWVSRVFFCLKYSRLDVREAGDSEIPMEVGKQVFTLTKDKKGAAWEDGKLTITVHCSQSYGG